MLSKLSLLLLTLLQTSLALAGNAIISNRCPYDIWVWSIEPSRSSAPIRVAARSQYSEPLRQPCEGCTGGVALKVSKTNQLLSGAQTQFEYTIVQNQVWFDVSFVDCAQGQNAGSCPGHDKGLAIESAESKCGKAYCKGGSYCPTQAYYVDQPLLKLGLQEPVFTCPGAGLGMDLVMKVCADEAPMKRSVAGRLLVDVD